MLFPRFLHVPLKTESTKLPEGGTHPEGHDEIDVHGHGDEHKQCGADVCEQLQHANARQSQGSATQRGLQQKGVVMAQHLHTQKLQHNFKIFQKHTEINMSRKTVVQSNHKRSEGLKIPKWMGSNPGHGLRGDSGYRFTNGWAFR